MGAGGGSVAVVPPGGKKRGLRSRYGISALFLLPAAVLLGVWIVYPAIYTIVRSFFDRSGSEFIGFDNYVELFSSPALLTAIRNNVIWVAVVPAMVTAIGLIFAVLTERVRWSVAFKTAVFMPMAISAFAAGVIWRITLDEDPNRGPVNALITSVENAFSPAGALPSARASTDSLDGSAQAGFELRTPLAAGDTALLGLTAIPNPAVPEGAVQAAQPRAVAGGISGVVWRDFKPGGGEAGVVEQGERGLPGVRVQLRDPGGGVVASTDTGNDGSFTFASVQGSDLRAAIAPETFAQPAGGVTWLGRALIVPSLLMAYTWIWAGFAMVVIAAGLSAIPRDVLEAARTDGASEWQVFRRVTVPLLAPVLSVVFITMVINVLKVFDIVLSLAPGSVQGDASVIALSMWRTAFSGGGNFGLGSAIAVFLFLLVIPVILLNIRRFRREEG